MLISAYLVALHAVTVIAGQDPKGQEKLSGTEYWSKKLLNFPEATLNYTKANPGTVGIVVVTTMLFVGPALVVAPILASLGFGPLGPVAGGAAAWYQAGAGAMHAGGLFAAAQGAAMGGPAVAIFTGGLRLMAAAGNAVCYKITPRNARGGGEKSGKDGTGKSDGKAGL